MNHPNRTVKPYSTSSSSPQSNKNLRILNYSQHNLAGKQLTLPNMQPILNAPKNFESNLAETQNPKLKNPPFGEVATSESHELPSIRQKQQETLVLEDREHDSHALFGRTNHSKHIIQPCSSSSSPQSNKNLRILNSPHHSLPGKQLNTHLCNQA